MKSTLLHGVFCGVISFAALLSSLPGFGAPSSSEDHRSAAFKGGLESVVAILWHLPTGRELLGKAKRTWGLASREELFEHLKWGSVSRTDAVITRHFDPSTGQETRERQVTIFLRKHQPVRDILLDLAHELVHATSQPAWDPYDPGLTATRFIRAAIEGTGGEADAVMGECQVALELQSRYGVPAGHCLGYRTAGLGHPEMSREKILQDFYRVGEWKEDLEDKLGRNARELRRLSDRKPALYSSTGGAPYPVALLREFQEMTQVACENSKKRMRLMTDRSPASDLSRQTAQAASQDERAGEGRSHAADLNAFLARRCR